MIHVFSRSRRYIASLVAAHLVWAALISGGDLQLGAGVAVGAEKKLRTIGYVAGWSHLDYSSIEVEKLTHINYAFANVLDGEVVFGDKIDGAALNPQDFQTLNKLKARNPQLRILISVGGWTWSKGFSDAALTDESRRKFAASAVRMMKTHRLDGVDVDWEYPGQRGDNNKFRREDKENFTLLLQTLRQQLDRQSDRDSRTADDRYLLTIASGANSAYTDHTNLGEVEQYLDFINIMTYDFHHGLDYVSGHHANLFRSDVTGASAISVEDAVNGHLKAGVPPEKIVVGLPFYGRRWKGVSDVHHGLYQRGSTTGAIVPYKTLVDKFERHPSYVSHWDEKAQAAYLHSRDESTFISYDTPQSIARKIAFVKQHGLGGVMFWEYSDDHEGTLLKTIDSHLNP